MSRYLEMQSENIRVAVRIRHQDTTDTPAVVPDSYIPKLNKYTSVTIADPNIRKGSKMYTFDHVFTPKATQEHVYEVVQPLIERCLDGYNGCVFAYGQTNSGKTYTMEGNDAQLGVIPRVASQIIQHIKKHSKNSTSDKIEFTISATYLEIYQEHLRDLLNPTEDAELKIKIDPFSVTGTELHVDGLTQYKLNNEADFLK
jgi:hypothetical protein